MKTFGFCVIALMSLMSLTTTQMLVTYTDISTQVNLVFCLAAGSTAESLGGGK